MLVLGFDQCVLEYIQMNTQRSYSTVCSASVFLLQSVRALQCVAVCVAVCCSVCCSVLQCVAVCCSEMQCLLMCVAVYYSVSTL